MSQAVVAQRRARTIVLMGQGAIIGIHAGLFGLLVEPAAAVAALLGSLIVILNSLMQSWQLKRADRIAGRDAAMNLRYLYRCTIERYITIAVLFAVGIGALKLAALPLLTGFAAGHLAMVYRWFLESSLRRRRHG